MQITVRAYNELRYLTAGMSGGAHLDLPPGATAADALARLSARPLPSAGLILFRNGRPAALDTRLETGDHLVIMAPMTGG